MDLRIDYYASLNSPWTHLGGGRLLDVAARCGATVRIHPVDFAAVFPASGGLPLPKRSPQRQAYRLQELARWRDFLDVPIQLQPEAFPGHRGPRGPLRPGGPGNDRRPPRHRPRASGPEGALGGGRRHR